jgi:hypothetical protein
VLSVETVTTEPLGEGKGGALQARCNGGLAAARSIRSGNRKVMAIDIVEDLNIADHLSAIPMPPSVFEKSNLS